MACQAAPKVILLLSVGWLDIYAFFQEGYVKDSILRSYRHQFLLKS